MGNTIFTKKMTEFAFFYTNRNLCDIIQSSTTNERNNDYV